VKVDNVPFTDEKYGVGIKKGDTKTCDAVNKAITEMYTDGTAKQLIDKWFTPEHLTFDASKPRLSRAAAEPKHPTMRR